MKLRPTPVPQSQRVTPIGLIEQIEVWLQDEHVYQIEVNRRKAAENLSYAAVRVLRGSDQGHAGSSVLAGAVAETSARRLRRAAKLFTNLADRLED